MSEMEENRMKSNCHKCNELLKEGAEVWLHFNRETNEWTKKADHIPENKQEWFAFGSICAKRMFEVKE